MTTPPPADPPKDPEPPAPVDPPKDPDPVPPAPPAPVDPPKDPVPDPDDDVVKDRAELARLRAENAELQKNQKPKAPAPPKKAEKDPDPVPPVKRKRRVSRLLGEHYDGED